MRPRRSKSPEVERKMDESERQFDEFKESVDKLNLDAMNKASLLEVEPQTKISNKDLAKSKIIYLKPTKSLPDGNKFNERFRQEYEFQKEQVLFIAEHKESPGDTIEMWTHPFGGTPTHFWQIPTNKPLSGPRYLAEQIKKCNYHRLKMKESVTREDGMGQWYGNMVSDNTISRLDAIPFTQNRSIFMGSVAF